MVSYFAPIIFYRILLGINDFFLPSNLLSVGLDVSWWLLKNTTYVVFQGLKMELPQGNPQGRPSEEDLNIEDSVMIIEKSDLLEKLDHIEKMLENRK